LNVALPKQTPHRFILHRYMQVPTGDAHIRVTGCIADLSQRASTGQGMVNERVSAEVEGERILSFNPKHPACRMEPFAKRVPGKHYVLSIQSLRINER